jgi:hypothetical protein
MKKEKNLLLHRLNLWGFKYFRYETGRLRNVVPPMAGYYVREKHRDVAPPMAGHYVREKHRDVA